MPIYEMTRNHVEIVSEDNGDKQRLKDCHAHCGLGRDSAPV
jgi:hypothetical protein